MGQTLISIARFLCGLIDSIVYVVISKIYNLFVDLSSLILYSQNILDTLGQRIGLILGIFMLFRLAISLITYIITPDKINDKSKGGAKIITNIIVSLVLLATINIIFKEAYIVQNKIIESKFIEKIFFGNKATTPNIDMGYILYSSFLTPNIKGCENLLDPYTQIDASCNNELQNIQNANVITALDDLVKNYQLNKALSNYELINYKYNNDWLFDYLPILSTVAGVAVVLVLISFSLDLAKRAVELLFLQIIAPIPIIANIDPDKGSEIFKKWYKECFKVYLALFIRIIAINFAVFMITLIKTEFNNIFSNKSPLLTVLLIIGCLMFAKEVPKLIEDIFGIKMDGMALKPLKKFKEQTLFGNQILGLGAAGLAGGAVMGANAAKRIGDTFGDAYRDTKGTINAFKNRDYKTGMKSIGKGLLNTAGNLVYGTGSIGFGGLSATSRGITGSIKGEKFGQIYKNSYGEAISAREKRDERRDDGVGYLEMQGNKFQRAVHQKTRGQRADTLDKALDSYKSNGEAIKNAIYANDKRRNSMTVNGRNFDGAKGLKEFIDSMQAPIQAAGETLAHFTARQQAYIAEKRRYQDALDLRVAEVASGSRAIDDGTVTGSAGGAAANAAVKKILETMEGQRKSINTEGKDLYGNDFSPIFDETRFSGTVGDYDTVTGRTMGMKNALGGASGAKTTISSHAGHDRDVDKYGAKKDAK